MRASAQDSQAGALRRQADLTEQAGQIELEANDRQRQQLRRQYAAEQARNAVSLGAGNVDLASGSAMDIANANAAMFANDIGENAYTRTLKDWETRMKARGMRGQADSLESQASYAKRSASNLAPTIIGAGLQGISGFMSGYSFGGKLGGATAANNKVWDRALQGWSQTVPRH